MKILGNTVFCRTLLFVLCCWLDCYGQVKETRLEKKTQDPQAVIAVINGQRVITQKEVDELLGSQIYELQQKIFFLRNTALNNLITKLLIEEEAKAKGVSVAELNKRLIPERVEVEQSKVDEEYDENAKLFANFSEEEAKARIKLDLESHEKMRYFKNALDALRRKAKIEAFLTEPSLPAINLNLEGPSKGNNSALVTIVEFSDFQCPYCKQAFPILAALQKQYGTNVKWVFKQLPLPIHPQAFSAAQAAVCADRQGKFWEYHDRLFTSNQELSLDYLKTLATGVGLDMKAFDACYVSEESRSVVQRDLSLAKKVNIQGTPTLLINGKIFQGEVELNSLRKAVDLEFQKLKKD